MSDFLANDDSPSSNVAEFSVSELSGAIKRTMEDSFGRVRVRGELGRVSRPSSGHIYLDLKDDKSVLSAVIWKGAAAKMPVRPEEGLEVIATGRITTFPGQSKYQMIIDAMEPAGEGALMALLEDRKRKLAAEGLFDPARKQLLPFMPRIIGVVTSPSGAVIRDIIHRLNDRFPTHVIVWPVRVQGESSAAEVANAIDGFNALDGTQMVPKPDLIIVARGGGSIEDLWGFNEEIVARAAAASIIPLISAVGHETDTTLIDYVSDVRAPTPTGAAEIAVPVKADLKAQVATLEARLHQAGRQLQNRRRERFVGLARALPQPDRLLALPRQRFDGLEQRLPRALAAGVQVHRSALKAAASTLKPARLETLLATARTDLRRTAASLPMALERTIVTARRELTFRAQRLSADTVSRKATDGHRALAMAQSRLDNSFLRLVERKTADHLRSGRLLDTLSYRSVLSRGFALVRNEAGKPLRSAHGIKAGQILTVEFAEQERLAVQAIAPTATPAEKPAKPPVDNSNQGTLL